MEGPAVHEAFIRNFLACQFPAGDVPLWVVDALVIGAGMSGVTSTLSNSSIARQTSDESGAHLDNDCDDSGARRLPDLATAVAADTSTSTTPLLPAATTTNQYRKRLLDGNEKV